MMHAQKNIKNIKKKKNHKVVVIEKKILLLLNYNNIQNTI